MDRQLVILTPLEIEARAIAAQLDQNISIEVVGLRASRLEQIHPAPIVFLAGLAGALDPTLKAGDVVLDEMSLDIDLPHLRGKIITVDQIIATPQAKAELFQSTGALAVDMEGDIVRDACAGAGSRFIHIRAISDAADQGLDPALLGLIDTTGKAKPTKIASLLIRRPSSLKDLMQLAQRSGLALRNLAAAVRTIVQQI